MTVKHEALPALDVYLRCAILTAWIEDGGVVYMLSMDGVTRNDYRPYLTTRDGAGA